MDRLAATHEACSALLGEAPSAITLQALASALRPIFQARVAVLLIGDSPPLEGASPLGTGTRGWRELLDQPRPGSTDRVATLTVDPHDDRFAAAGIDRLVVVPIDEPRGSGALWLGYGKKAPTTSEDFVMFALLGDYLALALRHASAPRPIPSGVWSADDLISQAAHDLRTPLTPISMLLQALERKAVAGAIDVDSIGRVRRQVRRLTDIVSDFVDLSRLREGRLPLEPAAVELRDALVRAVKRLGERDRRWRVELVMGNEPLWVVADADRTVHAFVSLLEHVARLVQGDGPIRARLERRNSHAALRIGSDGTLPNDELKLELGTDPSGGSLRPPPLGLGVRLADALFAQQGATLHIETGREGSACVEGTFPLTDPPSSERPAR